MATFSFSGKWHHKKQQEMPVPVFPHGNDHVPTLAQLPPELSLGQLSVRTAPAVLCAVGQWTQFCQQCRKGHRLARLVVGSGSRWASSSCSMQVLHAFIIAFDRSKSGTKEGRFVCFLSWHRCPCYKLLSTLQFSARAGFHFCILEHTSVLPKNACSHSTADVRRKQHPIRALWYTSLTALSSEEKWEYKCCHTSLSDTSPGCK